MKAITIIWFGCFLLSACVQNKETAAQEEQYVCPMHPSVLQDHPGQCPVCGMDLVKRGNGKRMEGALYLTPEAIRLANLATVPVRRQGLEQKWVTTGRLSADETRRREITSRAAGRIEKLPVRQTGAQVRTGQPLYTLYSEALLALEQEYLTTLKQEGSFSSLSEGVKRKLLHVGLTESQIGSIREAGAEVEFLSPVSGWITSVNVAEGQYVEEGQILYQVDQLDHLWAEVQVFQNELPLVKKGMPVELRMPDGVLMQARIEYVSPAFSQGQQVLKVRAALMNPGGKYHPGVQIEVRIPRTTPETLAIPSEAIIRQGGGTMVWLAGTDGHFRPRCFRAGGETGGYTVVESGLDEGDLVVTTGAYLLTGEWTLKNGADLPLMIELNKK